MLHLIFVVRYIVNRFSRNTKESFVELIKNELNESKKIQELQDQLELEQVPVDNANLNNVVSENEKIIESLSLANDDTSNSLLTVDEVNNNEQEVASDTNKEDPSQLVDLINSVLAEPKSEQIDDNSLTNQPENDQ